MTRPADIRQLAARADRLFALHGHKHSESVAVAVLAEDQAGESSVTAVRRDHHGGGGADRRGGHLGGRRDGAEADHRAPPGVLQPPLTGSATTTGSSATRPTPARLVQQSLATGRETSHASGSTGGRLDAQPTSCKLTLRRTAQWRAAQRRLFNCNAERSRIAGPVRQRRAAQRRLFTCTAG
jgi:hypothetical protein